MTDQSFENLAAVPPLRHPVVLTIGTFDGVHQAHQALMGEAVSRAQASGGTSAVLTFRNHPREVVAPHRAGPLLTPWARKRELILAMGIDALVGLTFDAQLARMSAEDFVSRIIVDGLGAKVLISGPDFRFGHRGAGGPEELAAMAKVRGFEFVRREPILIDGVRASSTAVREALTQGDVLLASHLLGRPHDADGVVVTGDRIGRTIGFPTANLEISPDTAIPADGAYAVRVIRCKDGTSHGGMMNLGFRPTVNGREHRREVHLLDFSGNLEGERLRVQWIERLRDEKKFAGLEELKAQLARDREAASYSLRQPDTRPSSNSSAAFGPQVPPS